MIRCNQSNSNGVVETDVRAQRSRVFCAGRAIVGLAGAFPEGFEERVERDVSQLTSDA